MTITRRLPNSNLTRQNALNKANNTNAVEPGTLTPTTIGRLGSMNTNFNNGLTAWANAKSGQTTNTPTKDAQVEGTRMFVSHFIQVFNLGVKRNKYPAGNRSFYQLDVSSEAVPNLDKEEDVISWANRLVAGDPNRVAAGGAPMENPNISEVQSILISANTFIAQQVSFANILDAAEEAVDVLNIEADKVIKKVWDEVETFYNEESPESMRENARRWGVVYMTEGPPATLVGFVKNSGGGVEVGRVVTLEDSGATATTDGTGRYQIDTKLTGDVTLRVHGEEDAAGRVVVNIPEHEGAVTINVADILW
ncbi:MAG: hypothetical protein IPP77_07230 [Bacteroidetes bacterium]|nr:hypothetical protein [Bacteroidota bacterium]